MASEPRFVAGRDYEVLTGATPLAATADGVPVTEFFMFLCFPCYAVEPALEEFRTASLGRAAVTRVPVVFNADAELQARAFYAAEALGKLDAMHAAFYDQIHVRGNRLASRAELAEFFARFGVDAAAFDAAFDSSAVDASVRRAVALSREYGIEAVPTLVVAGRYATSPSLAGSSFVAVVEQLVAEAACTTRCDSARPLSTEGELRRVEQSREGEPR
jgi:thiol:disulfide interchange protein DsbA